MKSKFIQQIMQENFLEPKNSSLRSNSSVDSFPCVQSRRYILVVKKIPWNLDFTQAEMKIRDIVGLIRMQKVALDQCEVEFQSIDAVMEFQVDRIFGNAKAQLLTHAQNCFGDQIQVDQSYQNIGYSQFDMIKHELPKRHRLTSIQEHLQQLTEKQEESTIHGSDLNFSRVDFDFQLQLLPKKQQREQIGKALAQGLILTGLLYGGIKLFQKYMA